MLALGIAFIHIISYKTLLILMCIGVPSILLILFLHIIISDMEITLKDVAYSFLGIMYIISFIVFIPLIYGLEDNNVSGKYLIWILMMTAWGSDTFAYIFGKHFGKHKFSKVSPNKTIEGCVAGIVGAVVLVLIYTYFLNTLAYFELSYLSLGIIGAILCVIGQIGDFAASTIKRYFDVKDFSNLFPGHGGVVDRIDSVMFTAPFAFVLFLLVL